MKSLSIGTAWQESSAFLKREAGLLIPVSLLFIGVPLALLLGSIPPELRNVTDRAALQQITLPVWLPILFFLCPLFMVGGSLAIYALALKPGISLREALAFGFRRIPVALGAALLIAVVVFAPIILVSAASPQLGSLVMMVAVFLLSARLLPLNAVVVDRPVGVISAIRDSWALSRGWLLRLLLFIILISIPIMLAQLAGQVLFGLVGIAIGGQEGGRQLGDVGTAAAVALGQMVVIVMTSRIYRQLSA